MLSDISKDDITNIPMVTYKLEQLIRSKLFNHKEFVKSFFVNFFTQDKTMLSRKCEN